MGRFTEVLRPEQFIGNPEKRSELYDTGDEGNLDSASQVFGG
jgi:hypothetical protein